MPQCGDMNPCGFQCGSDPSPFEVIYLAVLEAVKNAFDVEDPHVEASAFARAGMIHGARMTLQHGVGQRFPNLAVELLEILEKRYGTCPAPSDSPQERRNEVAARMLISRGALRGPQETAFTLLLGDDFVKLRAIQPSEIHASPTNPEDVGAFTDPSKPARFFRLLDPIVTTGSSYTFAYEVLGVDAADRLQVDDVFCAQPENPGLAERIVIEAVDSTSDPPTATATFLNAHDEGAALVSYAPVWSSNQRTILIAIDEDALTIEVFRKTFDLANRIERGVTFPFVVATADHLTAGPYTVGISALNVTPVGVVTL